MNKAAATSRESRILGLDHRGNLQEIAPDVFDPRSQWAILDGLEACKWAFIFIEIAPESAINKWIDFFVRLVRTKPRQLEAVKTCWDAAGWRAALDMRSGATFENAVETIASGTGFFQEHFLLTSLLQPISPTPPTAGRVRTRTRLPNDVRPSPLGPTRGKGQRRASSTPYDKGDLCKSFNQGRRTSGDTCRFRHACSVCGKDGHPATECWSQKNPNPGPKSKGAGKGRGK
jgi:hypothetical protein